MTEQEITEGKKLIAEFIGYDWKNYEKTIVDEDKSYARLSGDREIDVPLTEEDLEYHTSWDWLMPAWNKFKDIEFSPPFPQGHYRICDHIKNAICNCDIELAFKELVEGIKWHNQQTLTNNSAGSGSK